MSKVLKPTENASKPTPLDEVRADARFNYLSRLREQQNKAEYDQAKADGTLDALLDGQVEEISKVSKKKGTK